MLPNLSPDHQAMVEEEEDHLHPLAYSEVVEEEVGEAEVAVEEVEEEEEHHSQQPKRPQQ